MERTIHLHVGMPKCGSSFLQKFLFQNRDALKRKGFDYPLLVQRAIGNATPFIKSFGPPASRTVFQHYNPGYDPETAKAQFRSALDDRSCPALILSSEGLHFHFRRQSLDDVVSGFDSAVVHVVIRSRAAWLLSHYTQAVKTGKYTSSFEEFLQGEEFRTRVSGVVSYADALDFWGRQQAVDRVNLCVIAPGKPDIAEQFLAGLGLGDEGLDTDVGRANTSPSAFEVCALASVKRESQADFLKSSKFVQVVARKFDTFDGRTLMTEACHDVILDLFRDDTASLVAQGVISSPEEIDPAFDPKGAPVSFDEIPRQRKLRIRKGGPGREGH